jgi:thiamine pyrophosphate-dependent acetolactate synthase large subunit-like protein
VGDGEMLASVQALWTAAHHHIPGLWVVDNNRSYSNDEMHQRAVAVQRNRPVENRGIAVRLEDPEPDFSALARGCGVEGIGPIKDPAKLPSILAQAAERVARGETVLIDVWTDALG